MAHGVGIEFNPIFPNNDTVRSEWEAYAAENEVSVIMCLMYSIIIIHSNGVVLSLLLSTVRLEFLTLDMMFYIRTTNRNLSGMFPIGQKVMVGVTGMGDMTWTWEEDMTWEEMEES